jgi:RimJ/RimL family protein N-acetyltransferase
LKRKEEEVMNYLFETKRLKVRELNEHDETDMAQILMNRRWMQYYEKVFQEIDVKRWIMKNRERYKANGFGLWAVIRKEDNAFLGDCGVTLQQIDGELLPEIGFHIKEAYCRQGYATEAAQGALQYVRETYEIERIYSYCRKDNIPSQGVMKKLGLQFVKAYKDGDKEVVVYRKG